VNSRFRATGHSHPAGPVAARYLGRVVDCPERDLIGPVSD